jgi:hypothetical protein
METGDEQQHIRVISRRGIVVLEADRLGDWGIQFHIGTSEAAPCPLQPCYFAKWDIFADTSDYQYVMGFPVCICNHFLPIFPISCHLLMLE